MAEESVTNASAISPINEGFMDGGDLGLRSSDGIEFSVHSILLSLASPVLSELVQVENKKQAFQLQENAEVVALMLKFIYPRPTPIVPSMKLLHEGMRVANKYQLESMKYRLREQLTLVDSPLSVYASPISALCIASAHGFNNEAELAASLASKQCNLGSQEVLKQLLDATLNPATAALVKLTGIPLVKTRVLAKVLFHFERSPMTIYSPGSSLTNELVCSNCRETYRGYSRQSPPEWQIRWASWIFEEIKDRPIADWKAFFSHSSLIRSYFRQDLSLTVLSYKYGGESRLCGCVAQISSLGSTAAAAFQTWVTGVHDDLKSRLYFIAQLEAPQVQQDLTGVMKE